jgi:hypothetical protein
LNVLPLEIVVLVSENNIQVHVAAKCFLIIITAKINSKNLNYSNCKLMDTWKRSRQTIDSTNFWLILYKDSIFSTFIDLYPAHLSNRTKTGTIYYSGQYNK